MGLLTPYLTAARMARIAPYVHGDVLDLGCGSWGRSAILEEHRAKISSYVGVEYSAESVSLLQDQYPDATFRALNLDRDPLDFEQKFDCVLMIALIEHLFNQQHVMSGVAEALKPDGTVVITTPTPFGNDVVHRLGGSIGLFAKAAVDDHIVIYNRHRFGIMAREVGLEIKSYRTFQFRCNQVVVLGKPPAGK